jgi:hypothetical protein
VQLPRRDHSRKSTSGLLITHYPTVGVMHTLRNQLMVIRPICSFKLPQTQLRFSHPSAALAFQHACRSSLMLTIGQQYSSSVNGQRLLAQCNAMMHGHTMILSRLQRRVQARCGFKLVDQSLWSTTSTVHLHMYILIVITIAPIPICAHYPVMGRAADKTMTITKSHCSRSA